MNLEKVASEVAGLPFMGRSKAAEITEIITTNGYRDILELGFCHGVSTCYLAAAVDELGAGHITTIDREIGRTRTPNIESLLHRLQLNHLVTVYYEPSSYLWRLMKFLETQPRPLFDLCFIDGAHTWETDGFAFLLVDLLLKPGGMIIFDDLDWTFATSPSLHDSEKVRVMPHEEKMTSQIRKVYELLVRPHPAYGEFRQKDGWAFARKMPTVECCSANTIKTETVFRKVEVGLGAALLRLARGARRNIRRWMADLRRK